MNDHHNLPLAPLVRPIHFLLYVPPRCPDLLPGDPWRQSAAGPGPGLEAGEALVLGPHGLDTLRHAAASLGG